LSVSLVSDPKVSDPYAETARRIGKTPVWIFHGDAAAVPVEESCKMYAALHAANANVKYTEYSRRRPRILEQRLCRAEPGPVAAGTAFCSTSQPPCPPKTGRDKDRGHPHPRGKGWALSSRCSQQGSCSCQHAFESEAKLVLQLLERG
jgi:hypothetical protein